MLNEHIYFQCWYFQEEAQFTYTFEFNINLFLNSLQNLDYVQSKGLAEYFTCVEIWILFFKKSYE